MSVDSAGRPVVVFAVCRGEIDGSTVYRDRRRGDPRGDGETVTVADWRASPSVDPAAASGARLSTDSPAAPWSSDGRPLESLRPRTVYVAYGWTDDHRWSTAGVEFTLARLADLEPGQVLTQSDDDQGADVVLSSEQFDRAACG